MSEVDVSKQETPEVSKNEVKNENKKTWTRYLSVLLYIAFLFFPFKGILFSDGAKNYYPDQWFKPNFVVHSGLSETEMNAVNDLFMYIKGRDNQTAFGRDNLSSYGMDNSLPKNLNPVLKKYSRRSLLKLKQDMTQVLLRDYERYPKYIRSDYFLRYSRDIDCVEWFVDDNGRNDSTKPQYLLRFCIRNLTDCYIDKMVIGIYSAEKDSVIISPGEKELRSIYSREYTIVPANPLQPRYYQQYICALREDDYSYIANHLMYQSIREVYLK